MEKTASFTDSSEEEGGPIVLQASNGEFASTRQSKFASYISKRSRHITQDDIKKDFEDANGDAFTIKRMFDRRTRETIVTTPREYQLELFERAKHANVIAVLDTGSGKTHISVLLLRHEWNHELERRAASTLRRLSFFIVDSVALVMQQGAVLSSSLPCRIEKLYGSLTADLWHPRTWKEYLKTMDVIICTAEILHQALYRGFLTIGNINLLILDEAHHAKKDHPYAKIMHYYHSSLSENRPKVFSMTASPVDVRAEDPVEAANELEKLLDSQILTASDQSLLQMYVARPLEKFSRYLAPFVASPSNLTRELFKAVGHYKSMHHLFDGAAYHNVDLGSWCAESYWKCVLNEKQCRKRINRITRDMNLALGPEGITSKELIQSYEDEIAILETARLIVEEHRHPVPTANKEHFSDKVLKLYNCLSEYFERPNDFRCIVFVQRRLTARLLHEAFQHIGSANLTTKALNGVGQNNDGDANMSFYEQHMTLDAFREGTVNCLFATSIAEEGLDIQACNLVVRFDLPKTMIQYVQSRGRARKKDSIYLYLVESNRPQDIEAINDLKEDEKVLRDFCATLPASRLLQGNDGFALKDLEHTARMVDPDTGAELSYTTSIGILEHFCSTLARDDADNLGVQYYIKAQAGSFVCELTLPQGCPITNVAGKKERRKALAKRSAAFEACRRLRDQGHLDANFLPAYRRKVLPQFRGAQLAITSKKTKGYVMMSKPSFWKIGRGSTPTFLYVNIIDVLGGLDRKHRPLALMTRERMPDLPEFPIYLVAGQPRKVVIRSIKNAVTLSENQVQAMTKFTLQAYSDIWNKLFADVTEDMSYWFAPVKKDYTLLSQENVETNPCDLIDWSDLTITADHEEITWTSTMAHDSLENRFFVDKFDGGRRFFSIKVAAEMKATDPVPEGSGRPNKRDRHILDYSNSLWKKSKEKHEHHWDLSQPVIVAELMPHRQNLLAEPDEDHVTTSPKVCICPQPLKISTLTPETVTILSVLPPIIHRIESYLIAIEGMAMLGLDIGPALALEAMTKDTDHAGDHAEDYVRNERGMGANYERLEFLGDCFLKMATSIPLLATEPKANEEGLHIERMLMLCNQNLFNNAIKMDLTKFVRSQTFSRRTWYQDIVLLKGKGSKETKVEPRHHLADKTVADICEASIGAALLQHNDPDNWQPNQWTNAIKAVTKVVGSERHTASKWTDYVDQFETPAVYLLQPTVQHINLASAVEELDGYKFKHPRLLASVFTHPSIPLDWAGVPSYQRLEFLGDALLDMACITQLFYRHPNRDPKWLTEHKMAMVSNEFYGALCVKLGFHRHLVHNNAALEGMITNYCLEAQQAERQSNGAVNYWTQATKPPKCLPDIVEAYVGAMFLDSGMDYNQVLRFYRLHMARFFEDMSVYDEYANNHPIVHLNARLTVELGCHGFAIGQEEFPSDAGCARRYIDMVMLHGEVVCDVISESQRYGRSRVATKLLEKLSGLTPREYRERFGCDCKLDEEGFAEAEKAGQAEAT